MIRLLIFHASMLAAYFLIRSGGITVSTSAQWWKVSLGTCLFILGIWGCQFGKEMNTPRSYTPRFRGHTMQFVAIILLFSGIHIYFLEVPSCIAYASNKWKNAFDSDEKKTSQNISQALRNNGQNQGNWLWNSATMRPLPRKTDLKPGNKPEVFLQFSDPEMAMDLLKKGAYVSAFSLGTYDQASWMLTQSDRKNTSDFSRRIGNTYRYAISLSAAEGGQNPVVGLQGMIDAQIAPLSYLGDGISLLPPRTKGEGYEYFATSQPMKIEDLSSVHNAARAQDVPAAWLSLPKERQLDVRIRGLCAEATQSKNTRERLLNMRDFLRKECRYSLKVQNDDNLDPLENFLFHEKRGHCELFATAGALAARAIGIPSRVAFGWSGGSYFEKSNLYVFRAREAHAWTEVLIDEVGWVIMDCTPESAIGQSRQAPEDEIPITKEDLQESIPVPGELDLAPPYLRKVLVMLGCGAIVCGLILVMNRKNPSRGKNNPLTGKGVGRSYIFAFYRYCGRVGLRILPSDTVKKLTQRLPNHPSWGTSLVKYHYRVRYGRAQRDQEAEEKLSKACEEESR